MRQKGVVMGRMAARKASSATKITPFVPQSIDDNDPKQVERELTRFNDYAKQTDTSWELLDEPIRQWVGKLLALSMLHIVGLSADTATKVFSDCPVHGGRVENPTSFFTEDGEFKSPVDIHLMQVRGQWRLIRSAIDDRLMRTGIFTGSMKLDGIGALYEANERKLTEAGFQVTTGDPASISYVGLNAL